MNTPKILDNSLPQFQLRTYLSASDSPDVQRFEYEINNVVYVLYGLTPEEIALVEGKK